uniref:MULE transposase domain-containing protein n=1 Tax=Lactuca sativa TaxID=4236 RepID=A0A9R1VTX7_LACSA|nr:hypothetical protein LSAT_V11C400185680 [Lactuca sativa]
MIVLSDCILDGCTMKNHFKLEVWLESIIAVGSSNLEVIRHYITEIANTPKMKLSEMIVDIKQRLRCATELIEGKITEHYARVWDYADELLRSNPSSTCKVSVTINPYGKNYFHKFYICFKDLSDGWKFGCRRVIGLDGCFLKGHVKGELLTAIGRDANNQIYPITWVVVDLLGDSLDLHDDRGLVVIYDQHKGLVEAVKDILPNVEHMQCVRHVYANFKKAYTGLEFKKLFWSASMSCVESDFTRHMETVKKLSPSAHEYLMSKQLQTWGYACEAAENGISECFNSIIVDARKKPLITMLEETTI